jgi:hypothetical protein
MSHSVTHRHTQTVKGIKFDFRFTAPIVANVNHINQALAQVISEAEANPDQFGLELSGAEPQSGEPEPLPGEDEPE